MPDTIQHISAFLPMIEKTDVFPSSWATIGLLVAFVAYCFLLPSAQSLLVQFFSNYWNKGTRINFESSQNNYLFKFVLLLGTFVCYGFFAFRMFDYQFLYEVADWIYVCAFSLFFFVAFWLKIAIVFFFGYVFNKSFLASVYVKDVISLVSLNFIVLFPLLIAYLFVVNLSSFFLFNIVIVVASLSVVLLFVKLFRLFFQGFSSLFYMFLYLCTSEILPVLLVIKVISDKFLIVEF